MTDTPDPRIDSIPLPPFVTRYTRVVALVLARGRMRRKILRDSLRGLDWDDRRWDVREYAINRLISIETGRPAYRPSSFRDEEDDV